MLDRCVGCIKLIDGKCSVYANPEAKVGGCLFNKKSEGTVVKKKEVKKFSLISKKKKRKIAAKLKK